MEKMENIPKHIGKEIPEKERLEDLMKKLPTEFATAETFTLNDVNDAFGDYTSDGRLYTAEEMADIIDEYGLIYHNEKTGEYSFNEEFVLDKAA